MREKIEQNRKHMCKLQKVPAYPKRFMEEGSQDAWEGTLTMAIFKSFVIYRQLLFHSDALTKMFLQRCFILEKFTEKTLIL